MSEPKKMDLKSMDITEDKKEKLRQLFPEVFTEKKIDFEKLKLVLREMIETGKERYGLNWAGKADCFKIIQQPSVGTLKTCPDESANFDDTENIFIEGDNLEVLKLLQKAYYGRVKMMYFDPPYNTGNDFIYPDNYSESLDTYLKYTGQVDSEGRKYSTNAEADGRFHTKWINMMYPRLYLARNLLRDDGVIFISIDDKELDNLIKIMHEIFGEECFVGMITWKARVKPVNIGDAKYRPQSETEYVLIYEKKDSQGKFTPLYTGGVRSYPYQLDGRKYRLTTILKSNRGINYRATMSFELNGYMPPEGQRWQAGEEVIRQLYNDGYIEFRDGTPFKRYFEDEEGAEHDPFYCFMEVEWSGTSEAGKMELNELVGNNHGFDTVKPSRIIKTLIQSCCQSDSDDIILDIFAGSCTTAHAVLEMNREDGGNRRFICIQLPEPCDEGSDAYKAGFKTISDIGKKRIDKVVQKIKMENETKLDLGSNKKQDLGFKVLKLAKSNFKIWDTENAEEAKKLEEQLQLHVDHIDPKSTQEDILYELLLKSGFDLATEIEKLSLVGKTVFSIADGAMLICLEEKLTKEVINAMAEMKPSRVICLDKGFKDNDQLKANAVQIMKSKKVNTFLTV